MGIAKKKRENGLIELALPVGSPARYGYEVGKLVGASRPKFEFRPEGQIWHICFNNRYTPLPSLGGFKIIHHALKSPNERFDGYELLAKMESVPVPRSEPISVEDDLLLESVEDVEESKSLSIVTTIDGEGDGGNELIRIEGLKKERERVRAEFEERGGDWRLDLIGEIEDEIHKLTMPGGKVKRPRNEQGKQKDRCYQLIKKAIRAIGEFNPDLASHLETSFKTPEKVDRRKRHSGKGAFVQYRPVDKIDWAL